MGEVVEIVASTVTRSLGDGIIVGNVVLTLWGAVGEEVTTEGGTAALQIATATEITHEIEPGEFQTAEIGVTGSRKYRRCLHCPCKDQGCLPEA